MAEYLLPRKFAETQIFSADDVMASDWVPTIEVFVDYQYICGCGDDVI